MTEPSLLKKIVFALIPTLVLLLAVEGALRWTGADQRCRGYENNLLWACDPLLYFKINPGQVIEGKPLNSAGFRAPEFSPPRPGVPQVVSLGDSCTYGVLSPDQVNGLQILSQPYPQRLQTLADERLGAGRLEVFNAGVPGYNTYQGLMLLRTKLRHLRPDVITVRFGWNDLAMSKEQALGNAFEESDSALVRGVEDILLRTSIYPFARRLGAALGERLGAPRALPPPSRGGPGTARPTEGAEARTPTQAGAETSPTAAPGWRPSVPVERFARNLRRIVELGRDMGAEVWLLTEPDPLVTAEDLRRYEAARPGSSARLTLGLNRIPSFARLAELIREYNQAARQVAAETGAVLVDMSAVYREHPAAELFTPGDVVHPNEAGHQLEAEVLLERLRQRGVVPP